MMPAEKFDLKGRVAIVSGGAGFLGQRFCHVLAEAGATVVATDVRHPGETGGKERWGPAFESTIFFEAADLRDPTAGARVVERTVALHGRLDVLVNAAALDPKVDVPSGGGPAGAFTTLPLEAWKASLDVDLTGTFLLTQAACREFERSRRGAIVNVSSTYGLVGPDQRIYDAGFVKPVTYSVTKSAIVGFTRWLAAYYRGTEIRVNALAPGGVRRGHDPGFVERYGSRAILGRMAEPHELDGAILFLASDASSYVTGATLVVDGGWTAW